MKRFDRKFGSDFIDSVPTGPGVYLFRDESDAVLYVGKAKNLRRRLSSYRGASKRKVHRKMRAVVSEASRVEIRSVESEAQALELECSLIRELRPPLNVDGAYSFLYPAIGVHHAPERTLLCFTTATAAWSAYGFRWFGVFRSRPRAKTAFDTLVELLSIVGHLERTSALGPRPDAPGSRLAGVRRLDASLIASLQEWLAGGSEVGLSALARALLEKPRARRDAEPIGAALRELKAFYERDLRPLKEALVRGGRAGTFIAQEERDLLFLRMRDASG
jgi:excinuclease ABC subunit C